MSRAGMKLRAGCMAFRIRWVEECERKRDEALASRDEARELRRIAEARANGQQNTAHALDAQVADTERVLTHRGFPHPGGGEHLALAVDNALDTYAERLQTFAETVASHLQVDVAARAAKHYPVRPDTELLERVQDARNGERRYDALRHKMIEGLGLHPMATDDALVRAAHERPFGHTRWQAEVIDLVGGGRTDSELLSRLRQIIVDGATAQQRCDELQERARRVGSPANGGIFEISFERNSQQYDDGYTLEHDDQHTRQELITAAGVYLGFLPVTHWPWEASGWGKGGRIRQLAKAGALLAAEIDRLRRAQNRGLIDLDEALDDEAEIQDAESVWSDGVPPGGYVCGACGMPVESEPCREHQPKAIAAMRAPYDPAMGGDVEPPSGREPEQHYAEKAIERARDYLISLGYERVVDDHGEDVASMLREIGVIARQSTDTATLTPSGAGCAACGMGGLVCSVHPDLPPAATTSRPNACPCGAWVRRCPNGCEVLVGDRVLRLLNQAIRPVPGAGRPDWADGQPITRNDLADGYESGVRAGRAQTNAEVEQARVVLAPHVDTTGTPLDTLARASIDSNRTLAVAAELRWWSWGRIVRASELLARATDLDPSYAPAPDQARERPYLPPRPDVWAEARERCDEVPF